MLIHGYDPQGPHTGTAHPDYDAYVRRELAAALLAGPDDAGYIRLLVDSVAGKRRPFVMIKSGAVVALAHSLSDVIAGLVDRDFLDYPTLKKMRPDCAEDFRRTQKAIERALPPVALAAPGSRR